MLVMNHVDGVVVFTLSGDVGQTEMAEFSRELGTMLAGGSRRFVLQMDRVEHVQYHCLDLLIRSCATLKRHGGELRIAGASRYVRNIMRFVGVEQHLRVYPSTGEAVASWVPVRVAQAAAAVGVAAAR
jgi:anti-anti-sigma factor